MSAVHLSDNINTFIKGIDDYFLHVYHPDKTLLENDYKASVIQMVESKSGFKNTGGCSLTLLTN